MIALLAFTLFAVLTILSALLVIFAKNPVHSVLWLIVAFFNAAGLMLLMGAEFIAMLLVVVYVGAVAVLFLFIVMMLDIDFAKLRSGLSKNLPFAILIGLVMLSEVVVAMMARPALRAADTPAPGETLPIVPNIEAIGNALYSRYLLPFELAGLILLVALIGAIVLTHRTRGDSRNQNVARQVARRQADAVKLTQPKTGEGVTL